VTAEAVSELFVALSKLPGGIDLEGLHKLSELFVAGSKLPEGSGCGCISRK
jgi:hypothetical protein